MRRGRLIGLGVAVLLLTLPVAQMAPGAPRRFTPKPHSPDGRPAGTPQPPDPPDPPPPVEVTPPVASVGVIVDTGSRIRATLVGANRIELQANCEWRLVAMAHGMSVLAEGGPTGESPRYITLPKDAIAYWVTAR